MPWLRRIATLVASTVLSLLLLLTARAHAQMAADWTQPMKPFRIAGNLYYIGSKGLASYLITTPKGHILINSDLEANVPMLQDSLKQLGFKMTDVKILLISHAHFDHDAGSAAIKKLSGASYQVMAEDIPVVESGGKADFQYNSKPEWLYPPTKVDRALHDGDQVSLGGTTLVAHLTPGHTRGCTTWTMKLADGGKTYDVVIVGSPNVNPGYKLVGNDAYPKIAEDYRRMFKVLAALPCDFFLGAHGAYFNMDDKLAKLASGGANPFIDPEGYKKFVADKDAEFRKELDKQTAAAH